MEVGCGAFPSAVWGCNVVWEEKADGCESVEEVFIVGLFCDRPVFILLSLSSGSD